MPSGTSKPQTQVEMDITTALKVYLGFICFYLILFGF